MEANDIKSVYNFVPAPTENEVFKPDWADQVSHDIPFSDGESGEIELTITAKTPIFVRNGHSKADAEAENKKYLEFSNIDRGNGKEYFIPATSIKGMIRNVLEIMSFSRMTQVNNNRYSFRDLTNNSLYMKSYNSSEVKAGWLIQDSNGKWEIEECEKLAFIHHKELVKKGIPFRNLYLNKQPNKKTAEAKYKMVDNELMTANFSTYTKKLFGNVTKQIAKYDEKGEKGTLVFSGQSSKRNEYIDKDGKLKARGKVHEFVFFNAKNPNFFDIDVKMQKDFKFIYLDHDKQNVSKDWKFWKEKLEKGEKVPVFFNKKNETEIKHFGLAFMYKLPFEQSIHETLPIREYKKNKKDLAELIFGSINKKNDELKGRVFFSHAFSENAISSNKDKKEILASPKASYFPFYLEQTKEGKSYKTYMNDDAKLRGFKRYYVNENIKTGEYDDKQLKNDKIFTKFKPLEKGAEFKCKIRFHNLCKVEIGALLSAITFHGTEDKSFHSLGAAKPFGYGKVSISNVNLNFLKEDKKHYLTKFEEFANKELNDKEWLKSDIIKELFTIAQISELSVYPKITDFVAYKKDKLFLPRFSEGKKNIKVNKFTKIENVDEYKFNVETLNNLIEKVKSYDFIEIPEELHEKVISAIKIIYQNHRGSRLKLSNKEFKSEYKWHTIISNWIGIEKAFELYKELTGKNE